LSTKWSSRRRVSRTEVALTAAFLLAVTGVFVAVAVLSYQWLVREDVTAPSKLPPLALVGPEETVFDYTKDACSPIDIPDSPARAFRDAEGQVHLIASHYVTRAMVGPSLDTVRHDCRRVMLSDLDGDPARFDDREWLTAPYTLDGRTVYTLIHDEYQGDKHEGRCPSGKYLKCWYNAITLARSTDGGRTFTHAPPPRQLVAAVPYRYQPDVGRPYGLFQPSNIVHKDDYFYALVRAAPFGAQRGGACLLRTPRLDRPDAWRAWGGDGFDVTFADPYSSPGEEGHTCAPVSSNEIDVMTDSLTYNTYLERYVLVSASAIRMPGRAGLQTGLFYSTSDDLIEWTQRKLIREVVFPWTFRCGDPNPLSNPSLIDPDSTSGNFETTGRTPWLYFNRFHYKDCHSTLNRDLVRIQVRFAK
jgi:hypothetical protein